MKAVDAWIPSGAQTYSKAPDRYPTGAPIQAVAAGGGMVVAHRGVGHPGGVGPVEYIDCVNGLGAVILGHGDNDVGNAMERQALKGIAMPLPTELEVQMADRLVFALPEGLEAVRFGKNGCDVTGAAVRIARAATGRERVVYNGYHGHHDWSMTYPPRNGGVPECMQGLNYHLEQDDQWDLQYLHDALAVHEAAALVAEPVPSANPVLPPPGYWQEVRELCDRAGALLVLDEMVTAFRIGFPGACTEWGIEPDLWCGAKALANGLPLTAVVGSRELMEHLDSTVFYSTTHAGEALSLAAGVACWDKMAVKGPPKAIGRVFANEARRLIDELGLQLEVVGYEARPVILGQDAEWFGEAMVQEGMLWQGYLNVSWAHEGLLVDMLERLGRAMARTAERKEQEAIEDGKGGQGGV